MHPTPTPLKAPLTTPGSYIRPRPQGFTAHICASPRTLCAVRRLTGTVLRAHGIGPEAVEGAQLVVSELVGNAVRACGDYVPLVVEVYVTWCDVAVNVHDPDPSLPVRGAVELDSAEAESGRGLRLVDLLAPGWWVRRTEIGKQVCARVPARPATVGAGPGGVADPSGMRGAGRAAVSRRGAEGSG